MQMYNTFLWVATKIQLMIFVIFIIRDNNYSTKTMCVIPGNKTAIMMVVLIAMN